MKEIKSIIIILLSMIVIFIGACRKTEIVDTTKLPNLGGDNAWVKGDIDNWIYNNLTAPFNLQIKYKFDQFEADVSRTLVPVDEDVVVPSLKAIKDVFMSPYIDVKDSTFMKTYVPKQIVYIGSPSYNTNGSRTLGEAEGGKTILLYDMNSFSLDQKNKFVFIRMMHTIHHEFGHILNQKIPYSDQFQLISKSDYDANWTQISMATANSKGFVTPYSMSADTEDFVEMVATMLVEGKDYYEALVAAQPAAAQAIFRLKEQAVVKYYLDAWGIDFYKLQTDVKNAITVYFPLYENLNTIFKKANTFYSLDIYQPNKQPSTGWNTALAAARKNVQNTGAGADILNYRFRLTKADSASLLVQYKSVSGGIFIAEYMYKYTINANNQIVLNTTVVWPTTQPETTRGNARGRATQLQPLTDFFSTQTFEARWPGSNPIIGAQTVYQGGLYNIRTANNYVLGDLGTNLLDTF